jgi:hypothetical protein
MAGLHNYNILISQKIIEYTPYLINRDNAKIQNFLNGYSTDPISMLIPEKGKGVSAATTITKKP